jgi:hypothetical protein
MKFVPHGSYRLVKGRYVILCTLRASFNYEAALELESQVRALMEDSPRPATLIDNRAWGLATPEASEVLARLNRWSIERGVRRSAHITDNALTKILIDENLSPDSERYVRRHFPDVEAGRAWLAAEGYPVSDAELQDLYNEDRN